MRAELVAIQTALTTCASHEWIWIFNDSLSSLKAIRHHSTNPCILSSLHYHNHMLLLESITDLLEARRLAGFHTTLHIIRAHTSIRGNDLADAAAKLEVRNFDILSQAQTTRVDNGEIAPRPTHLSNVHGRATDTRSGPRY
jgi:ribonuclease HI